jgi:release factor glutamine methyltransferase
MTSLSTCLQALPDREDAEYLLQHILKRPRSFLFTHPEYQLTQDEAVQFRSLTERRLQGEPIAYLTQTQGFWRYEFKVSEAVLIPRPETELLIEHTLRLPLPARPTIIDLGTGSGCIAITLALEWPQANIIAVDASETALALAQENAQILGAHQIKFIKSNWYQALPALRADLILSNPPYIAPDDPHLHALAYEPKSALIAPEHGLSDLKKIIYSAQQFLKPNGVLALEHGFNQASAVQALFAQAQFENIQTHHDLQGHPRVSLGYALKPADSAANA